MESSLFGIEYSETIPEITQPILFERPHLKVCENQFYINIYDVAEFFAENGTRVVIQAKKDSDADSINLFLNGSVLGAILHQKEILPLHGSSFSYNGVNIIVCGERGVGKSSVTAAFCQSNSMFICDDITPIRLFEDKIQIVPVTTDIKLWNNALNQLNISNTNLHTIRPKIDKYYYKLERKPLENYNLGLILVLSSHNKEEFMVRELLGLNKFNTLSDHIYRKAYLKGMPRTKKSHYQMLLKLSQNINVFQITRPKTCDIYRTVKYIESEILSQLTL